MWSGISLLNPSLFSPRLAYLGMEKDMLVIVKFPNLNESIGKEKKSFLFKYCDNTQLG